MREGLCTCSPPFEGDALAVSAPGRSDDFCKVDIFGALGSFVVHSGWEHLQSHPHSMLEPESPQALKPESWDQECNTCPNPALPLQHDHNFSCTEMVEKPLVMNWLQPPNPARSRFQYKDVCIAVHTHM